MQPSIPRRMQHDRKVMVILGVSFDGKFCLSIVPHNETVTGEVYVEFLRRMNHNFSRRVDALHWNDMILQHDNARPHSSQQVRSFLQEKGVTLLHQPPYSPDYNICDRWWFSKMEAARRRVNFDDENHLKDFLTDILRDVSKDDLIHQFNKLKEDLQLVVNAHGQYLYLCMCNFEITSFCFLLLHFNTTY